MNELYKELESRDHPFIRYADDCLILVKSKQDTGRVRDSLTTFVEKELFLRLYIEKMR